MGRHREMVTQRRRLRAARPMSAGRPLEPAGNGRPRWMAAAGANPSGYAPRTESGVQVDSSVALLAGADATVVHPHPHPHRLLADGGGPAAAAASPPPSRREPRR
jgi:hypothetical protein